MKSILEDLRKRSEPEKQGIAFGIAGAITLIVFILWAVYFTNELENIKPNPALSNESASFVEQLQEGVGLFKENLGELKAEVDSVTVEDGEVFIEKTPIELKEILIEEAQ